MKFFFFFSLGWIGRVGGGREAPCNLVLQARRQGKVEAKPNRAKCYYNSTEFASFRSTPLRVLGSDRGGPETMATRELSHQR